MNLDKAYETLIKENFKRMLELDEIFLQVSTSDMIKIILTK